MNISLRLPAWLAFSKRLDLEGTTQLTALTSRQRAVGDIVSVIGGKYLPGMPTETIEVLEEHEWSNPVNGLDRVSQTIRCRRFAGGDLDAPKAEKVAERVHAVQTNLKAYGATKGFIADAAESYYLPYYVDDIAKVNAPLRPWLLLQNRLDEHFGFGMVAMIEDANAYFRTKFRSLVPDAP